MIDLEKESALPIQLNKDDFKLVFKEQSFEVKPSLRKAADMKEVIFDYDKDIADRVLYRMYRNLGRKSDKKKFAKNNLRFDITTLSPKPLGKELSKTKGHYHPLIKGKKITYPEVYEVIFGRAFYLLQKPSGDNFSKIEKCLLVEAKAGEKVIVPPGFGHVTINPGPEPLVMSNWVEKNFDSNYRPYLNHKGACYFMFSKKETYQLDKNSNYSQVADLKKAYPKNLPDFDLIEDKSAYTAGRENMDNLDFLKNPNKYDLKLDKLFKIN